MRTKVLIDRRRSSSGSPFMAGMIFAAFVGACRRVSKGCGRCPSCSTRRCIPDVTGWAAIPVVWKRRLRPPGRPSSQRSRTRTALSAFGPWPTHSPRFHRRRFLARTPTRSSDTASNEVGCSECESLDTACPGCSRSLVGEHRPAIGRLAIRLASPQTWARDSPQHRLQLLAVSAAVGSANVSKSTIVKPFPLREASVVGKVGCQSGS